MAVVSKKINNKKKNPSKETSSKTKHNSPRFQTKQKSTQASTLPGPKRLYRLEQNKVVGGVCGGLGEYFNIDPSIIRIIFAVLTFAGVGVTIPIYIILWIAIPSEKSIYKSSKEYIHENTEDIKTTAEEWGQKVKGNEQNSRLLIGLLLVCLGVAFLFQTFGILNIFKIIDLNLIWPIVLIIAGLLILFKHGK